MYKRVYQKIIYPLYHFLKNDGVIKITREFEKNQWKPKNQIREIQQTKLEKLLEHSFKNVPYYRDIAEELNIDPDNIDIDRDLIKLPFLTKKIIRQNLKFLISENLNGNKLYKNSTSGSTGEALYFYSDLKSDAYKKACVNRSLRWTDVGAGERVVRLWGAQMDIDITDSLRGRLHSIITNNLTLSSYDLTPEKMDEYVDLIKKFKPRLLISYPGPLEVFANHIKNKKIKINFFKSIITSAEQLYEYQRILFEEVFNAKVYNRYGCREFGEIAQECGICKGMHVNTDRFYVEILNDKGRPALKGESGELFITDLDNYGMPLIRYQIGDRAVWAKNESKGCKIGFSVISEIEGRSLDVVKTPDNLSLGGTYWTILFKSKPGIKKFQVKQDRLDSISVYYIPEKKFEKKIFDYFKVKIAHKCGNNFKVNFIKTDNISPTISGKSKIIISKLR